jgi:protein-S-isoprenylcysteine O-methyltransferase Ste14
VIARVVKVAAVVGGSLATSVLLLMAVLSTVIRFSVMEWLVTVGAVFAIGACAVLFIAVTTPRPRPGWWWHR